MKNNLIALAALALSVALVIGCDQQSGTSAAAADWALPAEGVIRGGYRVLGVQTAADACVCSWQREAASPVTILPLGLADRWTLLTDDRAVVHVRGADKQSRVVLRDLATKAELAILPMEPGWFCEALNANRNGEFVAVTVQHETRFWDPDETVENRTIVRRRFGMLGRGAADIRWVTTLRHEIGTTDNFRKAIPSDDGRYLAVVNWQNRLTMLDVAGEKALWTTARTYCPVGAAFTRDNKLVYTNDLDGPAIVEVEMASGKPSRRWEVPRGKVGEISSLALSADDRWLAMGTGASGVAFIYERATGKLLRRIEHRPSANLYSVAFSPDSKWLATGGTVGPVQVWAVPGVDVQQ